MEVFYVEEIISCQASESELKENQLNGSVNVRSWRWVAAKWAESFFQNVKWKAKQRTWKVNEFEKEMAGIKFAYKSR